MGVKSIAAENWRRAEQITRYYGVAAINTAFGYGLFAVLLYVGLNLFLAQIVAYLTGSAFNYFTYSRHVFHKASVRRPLAFVGAYGVNYLIGVGLLAAAHHLVGSPYGAGLLALIISSALNFFVLKRFVFPETS